MTEEIIISGFGGQGVLSLGKILAYAAVEQNKEVSWMPSYGPAMRGGTANATVIISDRKISSPLVNEFDVLLALNQQSIDKFEHAVKPNGILLFENNDLLKLPERIDIQIYQLEAAKEASKMAMPRVFNMILLGAYLKLRPILTIESVLAGIRKTLPARRHQELEANHQALLRGMEMVQVFQAKTVNR